MYVVFSVDNPDRFSLNGSPKDGNAANLRHIELSYIECPRQGYRRPGGDFTEDEPFAREAINLMRNTFLGKFVSFQEDYTVPSLQRTGGRLTLADGGVDASCLLLREGFAAVPTKQPKGMPTALYKKYFDLMKLAFADRKGIFASDKEQAKHTHHMFNMATDKLLVEARRLSGTFLSVVVERVLSASSLIAMAPEKFGDAQIPVILSGITTRGMEEELSSAAKFVTEKNLLHRTVTAHVDGVDGFENVMVSILPFAASAPSAASPFYFQAELLSRGLCKISSGSVTLSPGIEDLMKAEEHARNERKGLWKDYSPPVVAASPVLTVSATPESDGSDDAHGVKSGAAATGASLSSGSIPTFDAEGKPGPSYTGPKTFTGKLIQVIHGDTLVIRDNETRQQVRVGLAGLRCNKTVTRDKDGNSPECRVTYSDYSWEAKEFMRENYVGEQVHVSVVYARMVPPTTELRPAVILKHASTDANLGAALLEEGLATFFLGKTGICPCASEYQAAEAAAKEAGRGVHAEGAAHRSTTILELSHLGETRSRYYLSFLQRGMQGNRPPVHRGIVDIVMGGNSMRAYIPKENFQIPIRLAGVVAPSGSASSGSPADPFFDECKEFVVDRVQQREVSLQVFAADRPGNFIAAIMLKDGTNLSVAMVKAGLATCGNADRLPFQIALEEAEREAQEAKRKIWSSSSSLPQRAVRIQAKNTTVAGAFIPLTTKSSNTEGENNEADGFVPCLRTEIAENGLSLFLRRTTAEAEETMQNISELLKQLIASTTKFEMDEKRHAVGQKVAVQYKADMQWYRGRVLRLSHKSGQLMAQVQFVDYGTIQESTQKQIHSIPKLGDYTYLLNTPPLAFEAKLAYLKPRIPENIVELASGLTFEYTEEPLLAKAEYRDQAGNTYYRVTVSETETSLNEELLQNGAAFYDSRASSVNPPVAKRHQAAVEIARASHLGVWMYGDADDDEGYY